MPATIIIRRKRMLWNSTAATYAVELDGVAVGRIRNGESLVLTTEPGRHHLEIRLRIPEIRIGRISLTGNPTAAMDVTVTDGQSVTVHCEPISSGVSDLMATLAGEPAIRAWVGDARSLPGYSVKEVVETTTSEEPIGVEHRLVQNSSDTSGTKRIQIVREFIRTMKIDIDSTMSAGSEAGVGLDRTRVEGSISAELRKSYGMSETSCERFTEEVIFNVRPQSSIRISLAWKRIWQHGYARVTGSNGSFEVPYQVVRALTFDQSSENV